MYISVDLSHRMLETEAFSSPFYLKVLRPAAAVLVDARGREEVTL